MKIITEEWKPGIWRSHLVGKNGKAVFSSSEFCRTQVEAEDSLEANIGHFVAVANQSADPWIEQGCS
jgi:hypothetical protein